MQKNIFFFTFLLYSIFIQAQVGINTDNPTETLDVNGTVRIRKAIESLDDNFLLTTNDDGVIKKQALLMLF